MGATMSQTKPAAQLSLETILERNRSEAQRLLRENDRIERAMQEILQQPPMPSSRVVEAFKNGMAMGKMTLENAATVPPGSSASIPPSSQRDTVGVPDSTRMLPEKEVCYAALAIVRSWQRRHKKNYKLQEKALIDAVSRLVWTK